MAEEPPPPLQMAAQPICPGCRAYNKVTMMRLPEDPIGCPKLTPPPLTLTLAGFNPNNYLEKNKFSNVRKGTFLFRVLKNEEFQRKIFESLLSC